MPRPRIMITDGGPHPADKWAAVTAAEICDLIQIDEHSTSAEAAAARKAKPRLELELIDLLETFHANLQAHERERLEAEGDGRLTKPLAPDDGVIDTPEEVADGVAKVAEDTPFAAHFALSEVKAVVTAIVADHTVRSIDIERSWHADRNRDRPLSRAYTRARLEHGPREAHRHVADLAGKA